jgi:hypothetical protein
VEDSLTDEDLRDVMRQEKQRGRKRLLDLDAKKQHEQLLRDFKKLLEDGTEEDFLAAIRALGLKESSEEFQSALAVWRSFRRP